MNTRKTNAIPTTRSRTAQLAGPSWETLDGSLVTGTRLASAPAPEPTAIPWLLLKAASHAGSGTLANVTFIQRLGTVGGIAPATGCDDAHLGTEVLVPIAPPISSTCRRRPERGCASARRPE
jgi:hypothetical protein